MPARITFDGERYACEVDGEAVPGAWTSADLGALMEAWITAESSPLIVRLILYGDPIDEATYLHKLATKVWAQQHSPGHPCLSPSQPVNIRLLQSEEF